MTSPSPAPIDEPVVGNSLVSSGVQELELRGFWRMYAGGGQCVLNWDTTLGLWYGTLSDVTDPGVPPRHAPTIVRFSSARLADLASLAERQQVEPTRQYWRYREPR